LILDTYFLVDIMNNKKEAVDKLNQIIHKEQIHVTSISVFELFSGVSRCNNSKKENQKISLILKTMNILDFDVNSAEKAGLIEGELAKKGKSIGPLDCMIASIAILRNEKLLTRNIKDFSKIDNLIIEVY
jgi:tRNA(fMet)-specific endonuclease VapC